MIESCTFWWVSTLWAWDAQPVVTLWSLFEEIVRLCVGGPKCDSGCCWQNPNKKHLGSKTGGFLHDAWNFRGFLYDAWTSPSHICARSRKILAEEAAKPGLQWRFLLVPKMVSPLSPSRFNWKNGMKLSGKAQGIQNLPCQIPGLYSKKCSRAKFTKSFKLRVNGWMVGDVISFVEGHRIHRSGKRKKKVVPSNDHTG